MAAASGTIASRMRLTTSQLLKAAMSVRPRVSLMSEMIELISMHVTITVARQLCDTSDTGVTGGIYEPSLTSQIASA